MSLYEAYGAIICGLVVLAFLAWYLSCWFVMMFRCQSVRSYFSNAHPSSAPFMLVNLLLVVSLGAFGLHWATQ